MDDSSFSMDWSSLPDDYKKVITDDDTPPHRYTGKKRFEPLVSPFQEKEEDELTKREGAAAASEKTRKIGVPPRYSGRSFRFRQQQSNSDDESEEERDPDDFEDDMQTLRVEKRHKLNLLKRMKAEVAEKTEWIRKTEEELSHDHQRSSSSIARRLTEPDFDVVSHHVEKKQKTDETPKERERREKEEEEEVEEEMISTPDQTIVFCDTEDRDKELYEKMVKQFMTRPTEALEVFKEVLMKEQAQLHQSRRVTPGSITQQQRDELKRRHERSPLKALAQLAAMLKTHREPLLVADHFAEMTKGVVFTSSSQPPRSEPPVTRRKTTTATAASISPRRTPSQDLLRFMAKAFESVSRLQRQSEASSPTLEDHVMRRVYGGKCTTLKHLCMDQHDEKRTPTVKQELTPAKVYNPTEDLDGDIMWLKEYPTGAQVTAVSPRDKDRQLDFTVSGVPQLQPLGYPVVPMCDLNGYAGQPPTYFHYEEPQSDLGWPFHLHDTDRVLSVGLMSWLETLYKEKKKHRDRYHFTFNDIYATVAKIADKEEQKNFILPERWSVGLSMKDESPYRRHFIPTSHDFYQEVYRQTNYVTNYLLLPDDVPDLPYIFDWAETESLETSCMKIYDKLATAEFPCIAALHLVMPGDRGLLVWPEDPRLRSYDFDESHALAMFLRWGKDRSPEDAIFYEPHRLSDSFQKMRAIPRAVCDIFGFNKLHKVNGNQTYSPKCSYYVTSTIVATMWGVVDLFKKDPDHPEHLLYSSGYFARDATRPYQHFEGPAPLPPLTSFGKDLRKYKVNNRHLTPHLTTASWLPYSPSSSSSPRSSVPPETSSPPSSPHTPSPSTSSP